MISTLASRMGEGGLKGRGGSSLQRSIGSGAPGGRFVSILVSQIFDPVKLMQEQIQHIKLKFVVYSILQKRYLQISLFHYLLALIFLL